jgi:hypothetical protein
MNALDQQYVDENERRFNAVAHTEPATWPAPLSVTAPYQSCADCGGPIKRHVIDGVVSRIFWDHVGDIGKYVTRCELGNRAYVDPGHFPGRYPMSSMVRPE